MKLGTILAVVAKSWGLVALGWLPRSEATVRTRVHKDLLLNRLRLKKQEPFIVSFRVEIKGGLDNVELAENLTRGINTPGTELAGTIGYSVARLYNGTFPPVAWPPSTTWQPGPPPTPMPNLAVAPGLGTFQSTTPRATAIETAMAALRQARMNRFNYDELTKRMTHATAEHADALVFGNPDGTTPQPTLAPMNAKAKDVLEHPYTLGRLIYDSFVNTPAPHVPSSTMMPPGFTGGPGMAMGAMGMAPGMTPGGAPVLGSAHATPGAAAPSLGGAGFPGLVPMR